MSNLSPEQNINPMDRPCTLCGERIGAHVVKAYGVDDERAGAMGLICPPMLTPAEKARVAQAEAIEKSGDFDKDLERLEEIRATVRLAASTTDVVFLLSFIDKLWAEYTRTLERADALQYGPPLNRPHQIRPDSDGVELRLNDIPRARPSPTLDFVVARSGRCVEIAQDNQVVLLNRAESRALHAWLGRALPVIE